MISTSPISSSASAASYHMEKNGQQRATDGRAEYYSTDQVRSSWGGTAAAYAGLSTGGEVSKQQLIDILDGKVTDFAGDRAGVERQLGKAVIDKETGERRIEHRAGWDFTFSAPKSVSMESEVWGRDDARRAHEIAVQAAMDFLQQYAAQARVNGEIVQTGNLVYARFEHSISRDLDPQAHTHVLIANTTAVEGVWYSLSNEKLLEYRATADRIYKNELANQLMQLGYSLRWDSKGNFEVDSYSRQDLDLYSKRSAAFKDYLRARGIDPEYATYEQRSQATLATRQGKDAPDSALAQRGEWQERAKSHGIQEAYRGEPILGAKDAGSEALRRAIAHITEREAAFGIKDLYKAVVGFSEGMATLGQIEKAISDSLKAGELLERTDGKFTTRELVTAEKDMAKALDAGRDVHQAVMTDREFDKALERFNARKSAEFGEAFRLSAEQTNAARMILTGTDRFQGVQGLAGTGKTTMLEFVNEAATSKGWEVNGHSTGKEQARKMEAESGIKTTTTARYLIDDRQRVHDATLAARALATFNSLSRGAPDFDRLEKQARSGTVTKERDATGRTYYTDKSGRTWTPALYRESNVTHSRNINHAGLTQTKYALVQDRGVGGLLGFRTVIKSGGSLLSEASGAARDKLHETTRGSLLKQIAAAPAHALLQKGEQWRSAGILESMVVRGKLALETYTAQSKELASLKALAAQIRPNHGRVLNLMDEASQTGQKQFNDVIRATEGGGGRTVFLGDSLQHQGVEAGRAYELAQMHMPMAEITHIIRQQTEQMKSLVSQIVRGSDPLAHRNHEFRGECAEVVSKWSTKLDAIADKVDRGEKLTPRDVLDQRQFRSELKAAAHRDATRDLGRSVENKNHPDRANTLHEHKEARSAVESKWSDRIDAINAKLAEKRSLTYEERADLRRYREELKVAMKVDNLAAIRDLAKQYAALPEKDRAETIILTSTNIDRRAINEAVRDELRRSGAVSAAEHSFTVYEKTGLTKEELTKASSYEPGNVVRFTSDYRSIGAAKGSEAIVESTDSRLNTVTVRFPDGRSGTFQAGKLQGLEVFSRSEREFAVGDRIAFTKNDADLGVSNGQKGTIEKISNGQLSIKMDSGENRQLDVSQYRNIEHAYASTSHSAQGQSEGAAFIHHNTEAGRHGDRETYVNFTRAKFEVRLFTQYAEKAATQSGLALNKDAASEHLKDREQSQERGTVQKEARLPVAAIDRHQEREPAREEIRQPTASAERGQEPQRATERDAGTDRPQERELGREEVRQPTAGTERGHEPQRASEREPAADRHQEREPGREEARQPTAGADQQEGRERDHEHYQPRHEDLARKMIAESWERNFLPQEATRYDDRTQRERDIDYRSNEAVMGRAMDRMATMLKEALTEKGLLKDERSAVQSSEYVNSAKGAMVNRGEASAERGKEKGETATTQSSDKARATSRAVTQNRQRDVDLGLDR